MKKGIRSLMRVACTAFISVFTISSFGQGPVAVDDVIDIGIYDDGDRAGSVDRITILENDTLNTLEENIVLTLLNADDPETNFSINGTNPLAIDYSLELGELNFDGIDTVQYQICDTSGTSSVCDTATIYMRVNVYPVSPIAAVDSFVIAEYVAGDDSPSREFDFLANDSTDTRDGFGDYDSLIIIDTDDKGTYEVSESNTLIYTPIEDEVGFDNIQYAVCGTYPYEQPNYGTPNNWYCDTIVSTIYINERQSSGNELEDTIFIVDGQTTYSTSNYLENNVDPEGDYLFVKSFFAGTSGGTISNTGNTDSTFNYTPNASLIEIADPFFIDTIRYQVCDTIYGGFEGVGNCVIDTIFIPVMPMEFDSLPVIGQTLIIDTILMTDSSVISLDIREPEGENWTLKAGISPTFGQSLKDVPSLDGVLNDSSFIYFPLESVTSSQVDTFRVRVCEEDDDDSQSRCSDVDVIIVIKDTAQSPVAVNDTVYLNEGETVMVELLDNDMVNGSSFVSITTPSLGEIEIDSATGELSFTSYDDLYGTEVLEYEICRDSCDQASVVLVIEPVFEPKVVEGVSPNGDDVNDQLTILDVDYDLVQVSVKIYNRWGNLVYDEEDYDERDTDKSWRGQSDLGGTVVDGTYFYVVSIPALDFVKSGNLVYISNK